MVDSVDVYFEEHRESKNLGRVALRGGIISVAMQYGNGALQVASVVVLARLLAPEDFGLVAIVSVLTSFAPFLIDSGLGDATAQRAKITPGQVSSLFWISTGVGLALALAVAACSPVIAWIYGDARLEPIAISLAITFVLAGLSYQHIALLRRTMQFGRIGRIQFFSNLAGVVVAIVSAAAGYGYWALILRSVTTSFCVAFGAWLACGWRPGLPVFDSEVKSMVRFGLHVMSFSVAYTLARAVDRILLGLFYRPAQVGYYQNATNLYENSIYTALVQMHLVGSAALSKLQSNPAALRNKYQSALSMLAFFVMPLSAILSVTAHDLTVILLGEKWRVAGTLLGIVALRGIFNVVEASQGWLHLSIGRADRWQRWGIVSLVAQIVAVSAGLPFGTTGVAVAVVVASALLALPSIAYAGQPIGIDASLVVRTVGPQAIGAVSTAAAGWWLQSALLADYSSFVRIVLSGCFCACIYLAIVVGLFRLAEPLRVAGTIIQDLIGKRRRQV
jgi:O-antigen/teichoic acid export membrane protein